MPKETLSEKPKPLRSRKAIKSGPTRTDLEKAVRAMQVRLDALDERLRSLEERELVQPIADSAITCSCDDLVGCLDDCVDDVKELRKRVKDVRTPERGH